MQQNCQITCRVRQYTMDSVLKSAKPRRCLTGNRNDFAHASPKLHELLGDKFANRISNNSNSNIFRHNRNTKSDLDRWSYQLVNCICTMKYTVLRSSFLFSVLLKRVWRHIRDFRSGGQCLFLWGLSWISVVECGDLCWSVVTSWPGISIYQDASNWNWTQPSWSQYNGSNELMITWNVGPCGFEGGLKLTKNPLDGTLCLLKVIGWLHGIKIRAECVKYV